MLLSELLHPDLVSVDLLSTGKMDVLTELGEILSRAGSGLDSKNITKALVERERLATTGVGEGVAIPHAKIEGFAENKIAVGISRSGIDFDAIDDKSVKIFVALVAPFNSSGEHLRLLAQISRLLKDPEIRNRLVEAASSEDLISIIRLEEAKH
jgi:PTS system nitrogen regulatory IIA component